MRNLVPCTFEAGTRTIHIPLTEMTGVENIRLIVNETQKKVLCSSMQKDLITSCVADAANGGWNVTYTTDLPALASGDALTVEIDLGNHNYIDGTDIILKAKAAGVSGEPFAIGPEIAKQVRNVAASDAANFLFYKTPVTNVDAVFDGIATMDIKLISTFEGCSQIEDVVIKDIQTFNGGQLYRTFALSGVKSISFPNLTAAVGAQVFREMCIGCTRLKKFSIPKCESISGNWSIGNMFQDVTTLTDLDIHPNILGYTSGDYNINFMKAVPNTIINLTLGADASTNLTLLNGLPLLNFASVKNILEHCANANMSGKTITFYTGGLTVQDDADGTLQTLYNSVVNTYGATIANLTITPYSA